MTYDILTTLTNSVSTQLEPSCGHDSTDEFSLQHLLTTVACLDRVYYILHGVAIIKTDICIK